MAPFRSLGRGGSAAGNAGPESFWALRDVSFEVPRGEVLGIIGRNGAGKSTLLKVLSRITEPTEGRAEIHGRVGSLLEVGTGFHPELTGRENIYLNGAILGMRRAEIARKFDEIVEFAEIAKFLDMPVKHYSSGMYMRLAFAVAAHLDPEILVVDEVLAVGDVAFQKKCLGKMGEVSRGGRTVLFVSHNMAAVQQLTRSCLLLQQGAVAFQGRTADAIGLYTKSLAGAPSNVYEVANTPRRVVDLSRDVEFASLRFTGEREPTFQSDEDIRIHAQVFARNLVMNFRLSFTLSRADGTPVGNGFSNSTHSIGMGETQELELVLSAHNLAPGQYYFDIATVKGNPRHGYVDLDIVFDVCHFEVLPPEGDEGTLSFWTPGWGSIRFEQVCSSRIDEIESASEEFAVRACS
jgi:lipopolysaccharide transport system ATP-binding protein